MTSLYRYEVGTNIYEDGVTAFCVTGEAVTVEGQPMVRLAHGVIVSADGWYETPVLAATRAATAIERMSERLADQAEAMLAKALDAAEAAT